MTVDCPSPACADPNNMGKFPRQSCGSIGVSPPPVGAATVLQPRETSSGEDFMAHRLYRGVPPATAQVQIDPAVSR